MVNGYPNHVALSVPPVGFADLSLLGARVTGWRGSGISKGDREFHHVDVPDPEAALAFLRKPGLLCAPILEQERARRGWHLTREAPDLVLSLRRIRSRDPDDMNCVEWIVRALELGGVEVPMDVLTPFQFRRWCEQVFLRVMDRGDLDLEGEGAGWVEAKG